MSAPTTTRYNIDLLVKVRDKIENEERHDQANWARISRDVLNDDTPRWSQSDNPDKYDTYLTVSCPTAACVAGWAASLSGAQMLVPMYQAGDTGYWGSRGTLTVDTVLVDDQRVEISAYAKKLLGLTDREAMALFDAEWTNEQTLENLDSIIIAAKHGLKWDIRYVHDDDEDDDDYSSAYD